MTTFVAKLKATVSCDQVAKQKDGSFIFRRGYFYRHGMDAEKFRAGVVAALNKAGLKYCVRDFGDKWTPFSGSATLARSSHFYVHVEFLTDDIDDDNDAQRHAGKLPLNQRID